MQHTLDDVEATNLDARALSQYLANQTMLESDRLIRLTEHAMNTESTPLKAIAFM